MVKKAILIFFCILCPVWADDHSYVKTVNVPRLAKEINDNLGKIVLQNTPIEVQVGFITAESPALLISFFETLPSSTSTHLDNIVSSHTATPLPFVSTSETFAFSGYNSTLGSGTTFQIFIPRDDIALVGVSVAIIATGGPTNPHTFKCGNSGSMISIVIPGNASAGQVYSAAGNAFVLAGSTVSMWLDTTGTPSYTVNQQCTYIAQ